MPFRRILVCVLSLSSVTFAQNPDAVKYAPRQILLVSPETGSEAVLPMVFTADGQQRLDFVPVSQVKESLEKGGQPIRLADLLALLSQQAETINRLQAENDKLWKVAMKDGPSPVSYTHLDVYKRQMEDRPVGLSKLLSNTRSVNAVVAMFLALLELVRLQAILLRQDLSLIHI